MKTSRLTIAIGFSLIAGAVNAAGPLYLTEGNDPQPLKWNTSNGPIPVWTDGGEVFTYDFDGVTEFVSIERANEVTAYAFEQWNQVPTSTFDAQIAGTIESQTGIADVNIDNADEIYFTENGYGFWVVYDTDGTILSDLFGVSPRSVLGIAFPEWSNDQGEIIEATALMNGYAVNVNDPDLNQFAGVFTHEFGHAINLSHSQTNGHLAYMSRPWAPLYPGVPGCSTYPRMTDLETIETMYPFIDSSGPAGIAQSTVNHPDDFASISNLYPTATYASSTGSISGVLRLKDGNTEYSGINVIARSVSDPYGDAVSGMTGDLTQGQVGPDGRYTINNLTPGEDYVVYIERIVAGGFPTTPQPLVSEAEYWNAEEGSDPAVDAACDFTPITAEAGVTKTADLTFNGYEKGIQYTPIVAAFLTDLSKSGRMSAGKAGSTSFVWEKDKGFRVLPPSIKAASGSRVFTRNGQKMLVQHDFSGNGIQQAAMINLRNGQLTSLGDLSGDSCGGGSSTGVSSSSAWAIDDSGKRAVGLAYIDRDGDGVCQESFANEIVPFVWDERTGIRELDQGHFAGSAQFVRAHAIAGNGEIILGTAGHQNAVAWIGDGPIIDLRSEYGATEAFAINYEGSRVAINTADQGTLLWNALDGSVETIGGLTWCEDLDFAAFGRNLCDLYGAEYIQQILGPIPVFTADMTDDGSVIVGRAGSFFTGMVGAMWIEDIGWLNMADFLREQGVAEAFRFPINNPLSISASGKDMMGGLAGASMSWLIEMDQVYVCDNGTSVQTGFPQGLRDAVAAGAEVGRCEFLD